VTLNPLSRASASAAGPLDRAGDRWLKVEEKWLKKEMEWSKGEERWLSDNRDERVEAWLAQAEEGEKEGVSRPGTRWDYHGQDEKVREWLDRQKELYRRVGVWNKRVAAWIKAGGDADKPAEWEREMRRQLGGSR